MTTAAASRAAKSIFVSAADTRRILFLAVPAMLAFLTQTAVNIVDTWFIGQLEEPARSNGQGMLTHALTLLWAVGGFFSAISVGTQAMVARRMGEQAKSAAGAVLLNASTLAAVASLAAAIACWLAIPSMYEYLSDDPNYIELGVDYTQWRFVGVTSMVVTAAYKAFYDGTGRTYVHFVAAVVMNIVNLLLCYALIFGNWGFSELGVKGAGVAAAVASWVGLGVMIVFTLRPSDRRIYRPYRVRLLSPGMVRELARISTPSGVATTVVMTGFFVFRQIVQHLDADYLQRGGTEAVYGAATTIIINVLSVSFFSCMAFGVATATLVSQSLGARDPDGAERYAWSSVKIGVLAFSIVGALEVAFPQALIAVFNDSEEVIRVGTPSMRLAGACGPLIAAGMILTQALFGAGDTRFVMMVEFALHLGCMVPCAYLFGLTLEGGLLGVWSAAATYALLLTLVMAFRFRGGSWKRIRI
ncbi:MAG: MATE family efflux transporter [Proteobacteria bacterium]|nr:MATE family efflux transporter [Pseudomonadota bacterium]